MKKLLVGVCSTLGMVSLASASAFAQAPEEKLADPGAASAPARGFLVQARVQAQSSILSLGGGPGFLLGYRGDAFAVGLGLAWTRINVSADQAANTSVTLSLFQVAPTIVYDVWRSADGRVRANVVGSIGYGRASASVTSDDETCTFDPVSGNQNCSTTARTESVGATLVPVALGFGGDYYLSRNFALGLEAGLNGAFVVGVDQSSDPPSGGSAGSESIDASANAQATYGMIRATLVLGD